MLKKRSQRLRKHQSVSHTVPFRFLQTHLQKVTVFKLFECNSKQTSATREEAKIPLFLGGKKASVINHLKMYRNVKQSQNQEDCKLAHLSLIKI